MPSQTNAEDAQRTYNSDAISRGITEPMVHMHMRRPRALIIAIHNAKNMEPIHSAHDDAQAVRDLLLTTYNFEPDEVVVMWDKPGTDPCLRPTRPNIMQWLVMRNDVMNHSCYIVIYPFDIFETSLTYPSRCRTWNTKAGETETWGIADGGRRHGRVYDLSVPPFFLLTKADADIYTEEGESIQDNVLKERLVDKLSSRNSLWTIFDSCSSGTVLAFIPSIDLNYTLNSPPLPTEAGCTEFGGNDENMPPALKHNDPGAKADASLQRRGLPLQQWHNALGPGARPHAVPATADTIPRYPPAFHPALVICLSTARDNQEAWVGGQRDTDLVKYFQSSPHPFLDDLYEAVEFDIRHRTDQRHQTMLRYILSVKAWKRRHPDKPYPAFYDQGERELHDTQDAVLSSLEAVNPHRIRWLSPGYGA
ncbi:hypothetical protein FISHEDRAFT_58838 [Fistulina hepatica ATCC 64428]|uniref:Uncharacterized protein n=1 Tax=Fistulina hepatica ATCC 64428 TaxID=1128425 RepID=A0A0D7ACG0_9AGAR|nr:hypothetical protein FISHEDRAFT_58838 [Fistulina hepatica ATCC 64428]